MHVEVDFDKRSEYSVVRYLLTVYVLNKNLVSDLNLRNEQFGVDCSAVACTEKLLTGFK